ncbi:MAG: metal ABC transporter solute-binding protein, Zn/Mn family [Pseudonocardiaceae bacterium]
MRSPSLALATVLLALLALQLSACGTTEQPARGGSGPVVVASTSWAGAFATAVGAQNVTLVAPASVPHAPDYEPKPSDLVKIADADYVLYAPFDSFAPRLKEAAGGQAETVELNLENTPSNIRAEVTRLGELFGTSEQATRWLSTFDTRYAELSAQVKAAMPQPAPDAVAHVFMAYWGEFAGLPVQGSYGPEPVTPGKLAELSALQPGVVLANAHLPSNPDISGASVVELINYPGEDLNLIGVFEENSRRLTAAVKG